MRDVRAREGAGQVEVGSSFANASFSSPPSAR
jgi:hypothetical protein